MTRTTKISLSVLLLVGLGLPIAEMFYLDLYHEEPRRLLVAVSMLTQNQWFVPHILGEIYLRKPPGYNWFVALFSLPFGGVSEVTGRMVSWFSWLGVGGCLLWITDGFERVEARLTAALAGMFSVMFYVEKVALAELDLFFTAVLLVAITLWWKLQEAGRARASWLASHALLGLALLTKGPVAYLFFYPPVVAVLWLRDRRTDWAGLGLGVVLAHGMLAAWVAEVVREISYETFAWVVFSETLFRGSQSLGEYFSSLVVYPLKTFGSLLPWSLLGLPLLNTEVRKKARESLVRTGLGHLVLGAGPSFLFLWFFPVDRSRYLMPLFPMVGLGLGLIVDATRDLGGVITRWARGSCVALGVFLMLMVSLPWVLPVESGIISFWTVFTGGLWMALGGMLLILYVVPVTRFSQALAGFLFFCLVVKIGYLFVFVPVEAPRRLNNESRIKATVKGMNLPRSARVGYGTDTSLEIPFYLLELGYTVHKETTLERLRSYPYYIIDRIGEPRPVLGRFAVKAASDKYVYGPRAER